MTKNLWILDVWGEGRIVTEDGLVTGFEQALNINKYDQKISNGPNMGKDIPNLSPVYEYENPVFDLPDSSFQYITLMGAPITAGTAKEMCRVFDAKPDNGRIYLYDPEPEYLNLFQIEAVKYDVVYAGRYYVHELISPFNQITMQAVEMFFRE